jgi:hypothetical protein
MGQFIAPRARRTRSTGTLSSRRRSSRMRIAFYTTPIPASRTFLWRDCCPRRMQSRSARVSTRVAPPGLGHRTART